MQSSLNPKSRECFENAEVPFLEYGSQLSSGVFYRNLKKKHISKKYESDDDSDPDYGWKLSGKFWKDAIRELGDLSLNECNCAKGVECSIYLQDGSDDYVHVAILDVEKLNEFLLQHNFVAVYKPVKAKEGSEHPGNPCHFELTAATGTESANVLLRKEFSSKPFPGKRIPAGEEQISKAKILVSEYDSVLSFVRNAVS